MSYNKKELIPESSILELVALLTCVASASRGNPPKFSAEVAWKCAREYKKERNKFFDELRDK